MNPTHFISVTLALGVHSLALVIPAPVAPPTALMMTESPAGDVELTLVAPIMGEPEMQAVAMTETIELPTPPDVAHPLPEMAFPSLSELPSEEFSALPAPTPTPKVERSPLSETAKARVSRPDSRQLGAGSQATTLAAAPNYHRNPPPIYPAQSKRAGEEGVVVLTVLVSADGRVKAVVVQQGSGFPRLDAAVRSAVQRWRFKPALQAGRPIEAEVQVPVRFELKG